MFTEWEVTDEFVHITKLLSAKIGFLLTNRIAQCTGATLHVLRRIRRKTVGDV